MSLPFVSVIVPCRDEAKFVGACLESIVSSDYPKDRLEVLVLHGMGRDGTRKILESFAQRHPFIRRLDNPRRTTPAALNAAVGQARGEVIIWTSAHARYAPDAISRSVKVLEDLSSGRPTLCGPPSVTKP